MPDVFINLVSKGQSIIDDCKSLKDSFRVTKNNELPKTGFTSTRLSNTQFHVGEAVKVVSEVVFFLGKESIITEVKKSTECAVGLGLVYMSVVKGDGPVSEIFPIRTLQPGHVLGRKNSIASARKWP